MFKITTKVDYGIIILRALALQYGKAPVSLKIIAQQNSLPYHYLGQVITPLKKAGLVESHEGLNGGYRLARSPKKISLQEIALILSPRQKLNRCLLEDHEQCKRAKSCDVAPWWFQFNIRFEKLIQDITLADLI